MHGPTVQCLWLGGNPPPPAMFCLLNWGKGCCPFDLLVWAYSHNRCRLWNHRLVFWSDGVKGHPKQWQKSARKCKTVQTSPLAGFSYWFWQYLHWQASVVCSVDIFTWRLHLLVLLISPPEGFSCLFCRYLHWLASVRYLHKKGILLLQVWVSQDTAVLVCSVLVRSKKGWLVEYLVLLLHISAFFLMWVVQQDSQWCFHGIQTWAFWPNWMRNQVKHCCVCVCFCYLLMRPTVLPCLGSPLSMVRTVA